jgi:hypothetical protein
LRLLFYVSLVLFVTSYLIEGSFDRVTESFALILVVTAYLSGAIAFLIHLAMVVFALIIHLPFISTVYAFILTMIAKIHLVISGYILKKAVTGSKRYKRFHASVVNSRIYQFDQALFHKLLKGLGIERSKKVGILEMTLCPICEKEIPFHGRFCTECGSLVEEKKGD